MPVRVGTSGFAYKEWKGSFYPEDLPAAKMLRFYAERFDTVEINNTFYRMPQPSVLEGWASEVRALGRPFAFTLKAPMWITHLKKLDDELREPARQFFAMAVDTMGTQLGPVLLHLPAYSKRDPENVDRLRRFFDLVPKGVRIAFEPSDESWHHEQLYSLLREKDAALAAVDDPKKQVPVVATASWGYLRLRKTKYRKPELAKWAETIAAQPWSESFVFFKHEDGGTGPQLGKRLQDLLAARRAP
jgi:uncharacterized protein YecE (DUF72 family)